MNINECKHEQANLAIVRYPFCHFHKLIL